MRLSWPVLTGVPGYGGQNVIHLCLQLYVVSTVARQLNRKEDSLVALPVSRLHFSARYKLSD